MPTKAELEARQRRERVAAYAAVAGGALGAAAAGQGLPELTPEGRRGLVSRIMASFGEWQDQARGARERWLQDQLSARTRSPTDVEEIVGLEVELEREYARRQKERLRRGLATAAAIPDPARRAAAVRALMDGERRNDRSRREMMAARSSAAVDRITLREASPQGAFWRLGLRVQHCAVCLYMAGRFWPWEVIEQVHPPVHGNCGCDLLGYGTAIAEGLMRPEDVQAPEDALRSAAGAVISEEDAADLAAFLDLGGLLDAAERVGAGAELREGLELAEAEWEEWQHPRDALGHFVEKVGKLTPKGSVGPSHLILDSKTRVTRDKDGTYRVVRSGQIVKGFETPADAGLVAVDRSLKSTAPDSVGKEKAYKGGFDQLLKEKGIDPTDPWLVSKGPGTAGLADTQELIDETVRVNNFVGEAAASEDKYVRRAGAALKRRQKNLTAKVQRAQKESGPTAAPKVGQKVSWDVGGSASGKVEGVVKSLTVPDQPGHVSVEVTASTASYFKKGELVTPHQGVLSAVPESAPAFAVGDEVQWKTEMTGLQLKGKVVMDPKAPEGTVAVKVAGMEHGDYAFPKESQLSKIGEPVKEPVGAGGGADNPVQQVTPETGLPGHSAADKMLVSAVSGIAKGKMQAWEIPEGKVSVYRHPGGGYSVKQVGAEYEPKKFGFAEGARDMLVKMGASGPGNSYTPESGMPPAAPSAGTPTPPDVPQPDASWGTLPQEDQLSMKLAGLQKENLAALDADQRAAVSHYTASGYVPTNEQLRAEGAIGDAGIEERIAKMDEVFRDIDGVDEDVLLWRGVGGSVGDKYGSAPVGSVIRDNGFASATTRSDTARSWGGGGAILKIRYPEGGKGLWVSGGYVDPGAVEAAPELSSQGKGEHEFILPRGTSFRVLGKRTASPQGLETPELIVEPITGHL